MLVLALALPALRADDKPKDEPKSLRAQYDALVADFNKQRAELVTEIQKAKPDEQQKLLPKYYGLGTEFAGKFAKLAEDNPKDPVATDALFWVLQNAQASPEYAKAAEKVTALAGDMPLKDLLSRINGLRLAAPPAVLEAALKRVEKDLKAAEAGDLLAAVAVSRTSPTASARATELLIDKFPDHKGIEQLCQSLSRNPQAVDTLKLILQKSSQPRVKAAAALALGRTLAAQVDQAGDDLALADRTAAEAEKYFGMVIDQYGKDNATMLKEAQRDLKVLKGIRVGKEAPEIAAVDLDEKPFKLSDYRGKVVLLDFWGNW